jgi:hypothetical protein
MYDHGTGRRLIQRRSVMPVIQKAYFTRARRLQRGYTLEEQFDFICDTARRTCNDSKWMRSTSAKEPRVAQSCFDHHRPRSADRVQLPFTLTVLMSKAKVSFGSKLRHRLV